MLTIEAHTSQP